MFTGRETSCSGGILPVFAPHGKKREKRSALFRCDAVPQKTNQVVTNKEGNRDVKTGNGGAIHAQTDAPPKEKLPSDGAKQERLSGLPY